MATVTVRSMDKLQHLVSTEDHAWVTDEPTPFGDGLGPNPYEMLLAALGSCIAMTLRLYIDRKGWSVRSVSVELSHEKVHARDCEECDEKDDVMLDLIRTYILIDGDLDAEQTARLLEITHRCPVSRTLSGGPKILAELDVAPRS